MLKNNLFLVLVFLGLATLAFVFTFFGWNRSTGEEQQIQQQETEHVDQDHDDHEGHKHEEPSIEVLLEEANEAIYENQQIMVGVGKYKEVLLLDSNNIEAIYQLGILSIQSNQLEKAEVRFKKLILLQPENKEYRDTYQSILDQLGK